MLNMPGPQFLLFYVVFSLIVIAGVMYVISRVESSATSNPRVRDPYDIAYLRGGLAELVRVTALALTLRGLLQVESQRLIVTSRANPDVGPAIEQEVLRACGSLIAPAKIAEGARVRAAAEVHGARLREQGLLADEEMLRMRLPPALTGLLVLLGLAAVKIYVAVSTGHTNIGFLVMLSLLVSGVLLWRARRRRTRGGDEALANLSALFAGLRRHRRSTSAGAESDATMLVAVYGGVAGSGIDKATWKRMFTRQDGSTGSSCGSSCGGGGGCGGGGCGGCGS